MAEDDRTGRLAVTGTGVRALDFLNRRLCHTTCAACSRGRRVATQRKTGGPPSGPPVFTLLVSGSARALAESRAGHADQSECHEAHGCRLWHGALRRTCAIQAKFEVVDPEV